MGSFLTCRDAIIKFAIEVYDINSTIIENKNDPEVQQSLANNSTIAKEPAHLFGEFQCSEKSFSYLVNGAGPPFCLILRTNAGAFMGAQLPGYFQS